MMMTYTSVQMMCWPNSQRCSLNWEPANVPKFSIEIEDDAELPRMKPRRLSLELRTEVNRQVRELLAQGIIRSSTSEISSPIVMQKKKNGKFRMCVDYRKLNVVTKTMCLPMPNGKEILYRLEGSSYIGRVDMKKGFHQITLSPASIPHTAFATPDGLYEYTCHACHLGSKPRLDSSRQQWRKSLRAFNIVRFLWMISSSMARPSLSTWKLSKRYSSVSKNIASTLMRPNVLLD